MKANRSKLLGSAKRLNINYQDSDGFSALHFAALTGTTDLISLLLEAQATVDIKDNNGIRPLHYAAWQGMADKVFMLLRAGASVNMASQDGQIPLHLAAQYGHYEVISRVVVAQLLLNSNMCAALLEGGENKDGLEIACNTPLHLAARNGHKEIIQILLKAGISINRTTRAGTALHEAALYGKKEVVRLLLDSGIDVNLRNTYGQTALDIVNQFTTSHASKEIKQLLREASGILKVRALKDQWNIHDPTALNIRAGDIIMVLEQHSDGRWKGHIHDNQRGTDQVGYFSPAIVEVISRRAGLTVFENCSLATGDRNSVGSNGSAGSSRSAGSGQSYDSSIGQSMADSSKKVCYFIICCILYVVYMQFQFFHLFFKDLTAIGVTKPGHRKKISIEIGKLNIPEWLPDYIPADLVEWLSAIGLSQYHKTFCENGYDSINIIRDVTWEDLQEIGIVKLGYQKKIMLAVKKLNDIQKFMNQRELENKALMHKIPSELATVTIETENGGECHSSQTAKMTTFQDAELSPELQSTISSKYNNHQDGLTIKSLLSFSSSQESIGGRSRGSGHSQEITPVLQQIVTTMPGKYSTQKESRHLCSELEITKKDQDVFLKNVPSAVSVLSSQLPSKNGEFRTKKRSQSLTRCAMSDEDPEEDGRSLESYGSLTRRPVRRQLTNTQCATEHNVTRSQSFAVRARKKGPPPPPPKRLSSVTSLQSSNFKINLNAGINKLLEPPGVFSNITDTNSVRGCLESSSSSQSSSSECIPFAEEGNLTIKQRPRIHNLLTESSREFNLTESDTVKRRTKPREDKQQNTKGTCAAKQESLSLEVLFCRHVGLAYIFAAKRVSVSSEVESG
uniref:Caskin-2-like n=1 Tax=Erpetoichthys calabaricus TaxID=27687 RepID=A0A8C4SMF0_ERPCA